jgi:2',3'-cyclic-nucleotide 2'-phosphodiesterase (5'-nucleotidase family)
MSPSAGMFQNLRAPARGFFVFAVLALAALAGPARTVTLTVVNTTDMHGSIRRTPGVYAENNEGSLLQCATLVRRIRAENPNTLLLDCGDIFQGTAESFLTRGGIMARAMNAMGYDAFAIGNHEFDWGVDVLGEMLGKMDAPPLAANLLAGADAPAAFHRVLPFVIKEVDGLRVAIVGLTTPNIPNWFRDVAAHDLRIVDSRRALEATLPQVRKERPQILILLVHQGLMVADDEANEINGIGRRFGEFDLVLGGHLHWTLAGARIGKVDYAQAGSGARGVMRTDLTFDTVENAVVDKKFEYIPVTPRVREDRPTKALVADDLAQADQWLATVLGKTTTDLAYSPAIPGLCPVQQLLCAAIAEKTKAEIVLHGILSDKSIPAGNIHVSDVWKIVPYENTVGCVWLTLAEIQAIMEETAAYLGTDRYFGAWGLRYEVYPNAPEGRRIRNLRAADGSPINGKRRIKVALNSYHLSGGGGRFPALVKAANTPNTRLEIWNDTTRNMVMDFVGRHRTLAIPAGTNAVIVRAEPTRWQRKK